MKFLENLEINEQTLNFFLANVKESIKVYPSYFAFYTTKQNELFAIVNKGDEKETCNAFSITKNTHTQMLEVVNLGFLDITHYNDIITKEDIHKPRLKGTYVNLLEVPKIYHNKKIGSAFLNFADNLAKINNSNTIKLIAMQDFTIGPKSVDKNHIFYTKHNYKVDRTLKQRAASLIPMVKKISDKEIKMATAFLVKDKKQCPIYIDSFVNSCYYAKCDKEIFDYCLSYAAQNKVAKAKRSKQKDYVYEETNNENYEEYDLQQ